MSARRNWTKIQTERVLYDIIARGRLSKQELRVCAVIWGESWGRGNAQEPHGATRPKFTSTPICKETGLPRTKVCSLVRELIARGVLIRHPDGSLEFNEHIDQWVTDSVTPTVTESVTPLSEKQGDQSGHLKCPNRSPKVTESVTPHIRNARPSSFQLLSAPKIVDATHLPADAGKTETQEPPKKPKRSPAQKAQDRDLEDLKAAWTARWPKVSIPSYGVLNEIRKECERVGCSPGWLIEQAPMHLEHPDRLLRMWVNGTAPPPERTDGHGSWHQWTERHKAGMKSIAEILSGGTP